MSDEVKQWCLGCPSYLQPAEVPSKFKRSIGAPVCARFGKVLGRPGQTTDELHQVAKVEAKGCTGYGLPRPATPVSQNMLVAFPNPTLMEATGDTACSTCVTCENFVRDDVVAENFGWTAGLCAAKGALVLTNQYREVAMGCGFRKFGTPHLDVDGIVLLPEFTDGFGAPDVFSAFKTPASDGFVDPTEYPTDIEVSDEEKAEGIRAWRKISDADDEHHVYLPIFSPDYFDPSDRALIPATGSEEHPELYVDHFGGAYLAAVCWSVLDETPAAWGDAGTGKTELFRHLAWLMQLPFRRVSITASTELDDLAGKMRYNKEQGTYFQYGRLPHAWMRPGVICLDEPNTGAPDVWQFLRPLTDNSKQLVLDMNEGEVITRHSNAYLGMAMNPAWDVKNVGAVEIGDADANRLFHVYVELPPEPLEREIIKARVKLDGWELTKSQLDLIMGVAKDIRGLIEEGALPISWAIRPQIKVARAMRWFDTVVAYKRAIGDFLEPSAQQALLDVVRSHTR